MNSFRVYIVTLLIPTFLLSQTYIDVVNLKNGDIVKGKIIENKINEYIKVELQGGSIFSFNYNEISSIEAEKINSKRSFGSSNTKTVIVSENNTRDCYNDGLQDGRSIDGSGSLIYGTLGGLLLGFIGWGIAYAATTSNISQPDHKQISDLEGECKQDYIRGYSLGAKKIKSQNVNIGGLLGTLLAVSIVTSSASSTY